MGIQAPFVSADSETVAFSRRARHTRILVDATRDLTNNPRPSAQQIEAYKELFYQLADRLLPADRRLISTLVARSAFTPRAVALYLAQDSLDVAIPCLLYSPVLGEMDLKEIARKMGRSHGDVIAKRITPPSQTVAQESEADAVAEPLQEVAAPQAENQAETLTETPAAPSGEQIVLEAADAPPAEIVPYEGIFERSKLFGRAPIQASLIEEAPADTSGKAIEEDIGEAAIETEWLNGEEIVALASSGGRLGRQKPAHSETPDSDTGAALPAESHEKHFETLPAGDTRHLLALARGRSHKALAKKISALSGLGSNAVSTLLRKTSGDETVYLIKALNPGNPHDLRLLLMLAPRHGRSRNAYRDAKALLDQLDTGICRMIFNQVGAEFPLPRLETIGYREAETDTEFTRAARFRREEIGRSLDGRSPAARPLPDLAGQEAVAGQSAQPMGA